jgi:hypothetical protein
MGSLIEMLANKKKSAAPTPESAVVLPILRREHEGSCGDGCACGESEEKGCCGG